MKASHEVLSVVRSIPRGGEEQLSLDNAACSALSHVYMLLQDGSGLLELAQERQLHHSCCHSSLLQSCDEKGEMAKKHLQPSAAFCSQLCSPQTADTLQSQRAGIS